MARTVWRPPLDRKARARRHVVHHANQLGIDWFDLGDAEGEQAFEHMASPDLRAWMADNHLDLTLRGEYAFS